MRRRLMLKNESGVTPILPPEYQRVEWIGSVGSAYIILQKSVPVSITHYRIKTAVRWHNITDRQLHGANSGRYFGVVNGFYQNTQAGAAYTNIRAISEQWENVDWIKNGRDVQLTVDGETDRRQSNISVSSDFALFVLGGVGAPIGYRCNCELKETIVEIGAQNYFLIPCYIKSNGTIGMYDTISNTFFTNAGSGTFTKGADV